MAEPATEIRFSATGLPPGVAIDPVTGVISGTPAMAGRYDVTVSSSVPHSPLRPWRTGRKVGRTIYIQLGAEPSDDDPLIGVMDSAELAQQIVTAVNVQLGIGDHG